ncbi:hypothetical protein GDO86_010517 [Hymenochirus boettgeri]|uniref:Tudor domain-containing protein n=1 Tax=Hymenochirus boettgeri TaxID=247094 RepID=A0A8T2JTS1_9PIPI|nr:hypothetical protein GDO86_010517 [Hymenochirus boettgeri]
MTVRFVDYGNEETVHKEQVRKLPVDLAAIPVQAFPCCLSGFSFSEGCWSSDGCAFFYEKVTEGVLDITVADIQEHGASKMPIASIIVNCNGKNINKEMMQFWQNGGKINLPHEEFNYGKEVTARNNAILSQTMMHGNGHLDNYKPPNDYFRNDGDPGSDAVEKNACDPTDTEVHHQPAMGEDSEVTDTLSSNVDDDIQTTDHASEFRHITKDKSFVTKRGHHGSGYFMRTRH